MFVFQTQHPDVVVRKPGNQAFGKPPRPRVRANGRIDMEDHGADSTRTAAPTQNRTFALGGDMVDSCDMKRSAPLFAVATALAVLCSSCSSIRTTGRERLSAIADKVWAFGQAHPDGFTLDIRTMTEPKEGVAVSYAATQDSHSREQLEAVVSHALEHDGYVGGWLNAADGLYYFDSTRLFPEDALDDAIRFGRENGQRSVFVLSSSTDIPVPAETDTAR